MELPSALVPGTAAVPALGAFALLIGWAARGAPWRWLTGQGRSHAYLGTCVVILVLWRIRAGEAPGPYLHVLGATFLALAFGARLALVGMAAVLLGGAVQDGGRWLALGVNGLVCAAAPIGLAVAIGRLARRHLPANPFVFVLVEGFAGGALGMAAAGAAAAGLLALTGGLGPHLASAYLPWLMLLPYPEGFLTGGLLAWLVMFYPQWVLTYRDPPAARGRPGHRG